MCFGLSFTTDGKHPRHTEWTRQHIPTRRVQRKSWNTYHPVQLRLSRPRLPSIACISYRRSPATSRSLAGRAVPWAGHWTRIRNKIMLHPGISSCLRTQPHRLSAILPTRTLSESLPGSCKRCRAPPGQWNVIIGQLRRPLDPIGCNETVNLGPTALLPTHCQRRPVGLQA